ncbi:MAG: DUF4339 domain-containing protein [Oligoflexia bacterium]|nr:DUF4339 domain-containing protein [Oligoflexia bacterium]
MSSEEKIWFIYITDHHEGPFDLTEIRQKVVEGAANDQSLVWKDGMPEWVALSTVPELVAALSGEDNNSSPVPEELSSSGPSIAEMLSQSQQPGADSPMGQAENLDVTQLTDPGAALASVLNEVNQQPSSPSISSINDLAGAAPVASTSANPLEGISLDDNVWTLKIGSVVSGLHSVNSLVQLAIGGDIPADAMLWRPGWTDFQPISTVPKISQSRKVKSGSKTAASTMGARGGLSPLVAGATIGSDDPTDPGILAPKKAGIFSKIATLIKRKPKAAKPAAAKKVATAQPAMKKRGAGLGASVGGALKKVGLVVGALAVLGGAAAGYFMFLASPIPSDLDVIPDDLELMKELVKSPSEQGGKFYFATARGTETEIADPTAPKFYVASNLAQNTEVTLKLVGKPGTLVNRPSFNKEWKANVEKNQIATFAKIDDDGKPLPLGFYMITVSANGAEPLETEKFLGGSKGAAYEKRLKTYKDKLNEDYDKEIQELKQYIDTLKVVSTEVQKRLSDYKNSAAGDRAKVVSDWNLNVPRFEGLISDMKQSVDKVIADSSRKNFYQDKYEQLSLTAQTAIDLFEAHKARTMNSPPTKNPDELETKFMTSIADLDAWFAKALVKSPIEALQEREAPNEQK